MLDLLENVEKSVEIVYTYGQNAINHAQGFFSFVAEGLTTVYDCVDNCIPAFLAPALLAGIGVYISAHVVRW